MKRVVPVNSHGAGLLFSCFTSGTYGLSARHKDVSCLPVGAEPGPDSHQQPTEGIFSRSFAQQSGGGEGAVKSLSPGTRPAVTTESWVSGTDGHFASVASALKVKLRRWVSPRSGASSGEAAVATA